MTGDRMLAAGEVMPARARQVDVTFAGGSGARTFPKRQRVAYPFHVGRALYLPGDPPDCCTVYLQSCSGGIFQHDRLDLAFKATSRAHAHITTAASTVVHTMNEGHAEQTVLIDAGPDTIVEYVPDPLILFPHVRLVNRVTVRAHPGARVILADGFLAHDPAASGAAFDWFRSETLVDDDAGNRLATDRFEATGALVTAGQAGINGPRAIQATVMVIDRDQPDAALDSFRSVVPEASPVYAGASLLPNGAGAWMRALSADAVALRRLVNEAWSVSRERMTGSRPGPRRK